MDIYIYISALFNQEGSAFNLADDGGIQVNENMETSLVDIYAAGDVCTVGWDTPFHWFQVKLFSLFFIF